MVELGFIIKSLQFTMVVSAGEEDGGGSAYGGLQLAIVARMDYFDRIQH